MELQYNMGVHSISLAFESGRDDGKLNTSKLLEIILAKEKMNTAFKKVIVYKGSKIANISKLTKELDEWTRRRIRMRILKQ